MLPVSEHLRVPPQGIAQLTTARLKEPTVAPTLSAKLDTALTETINSPQQEKTENVQPNQLQQLMISSLTLATLTATAPAQPPSAMALLKTFQPAANVATWPRTKVFVNHSTGTNTSSTI